MVAAMRKKGKSHAAKPEIDRQRIPGTRRSRRRRLSEPVPWPAGQRSRRQREERRRRDGAALGSLVDRHAEAAILLDHGADVHARDSRGSTPLHNAAFSGDAEMLGRLLDRGADISGDDEGGWTPLHRAARIGRVEEVAFLVRRGADAGIRENLGRTPLDVALENGFLRDRVETLTRLLGEGNRRATAANHPSPSEIGRSSGAHRR